MPLLELQIAQAPAIPDLRALLLVNIGVILLIVGAAAATVYVLVRRGMEQRLEAERLRAMGLATARILHQVKNPLQAIMLNAEMLGDEALVDDDALRRDASESIVAGADQMSELLADLSAYAAGTGRRHLDPETVPLHELVRDAVRGGTEAAKRAGIDMRLEVEQDVLVRIDPYFMRQALDNVIRNAREALEESGRGRERTIRVRIARRGDEAVVEVRDSGPGIEKDRLDSVFQPFVTTKGKGMGLGLAITRDVVEEHGGRVEIRSKPDDGTAVAFHLPAESARESR